MKYLLSILLVVYSYCFAQSQTALRFDGLDDYTRTASYPALDWAQDFTLEISVDSVDFTLSDTLTLVARCNPSTGEGWRWYLTGNSIVLAIQNKIYKLSHTLTGSTNLAVVCSNNSLKFYVNQQLLSTQSLTGAATMTCSNCNLLLGKNADDTDYFKGQVDELRIWSDARTSAQLQAHAGSCLDSSAVNDSTLVGYWNFEEGAGQFANNMAYWTNYSRLGSTFYVDTEDPTWETSTTTPLACYSDRVAKFSLSDSDPRYLETVWLTHNFPTPFDNYDRFWLINGDTLGYNMGSVDTLMQSFPMGMNVVQLVEETPQGWALSTQLLTVTRPSEPCGAEQVMKWRSIYPAATQYARSMTTLAYAQSRTPSGGPMFFQ